jgi:hypothetical protein
VAARYLSRMEVWFIFAMFGLKLPILGLGYFLYRVIKRVDSQWEDGGYDPPPGSDDGGGGGGPSPAPRPRPRPHGGLAARRRRRAPERTPSTALRLPAPSRRPAVARTRVRTRP